MLVSELKRVGNAVFLEVFVIEGEIGFLPTSATRHEEVECV